LDYFFLFCTYLLIISSGRRTLVKYGTTYVAIRTSVTAGSGITGTTYMKYLPVVHGTLIGHYVYRNQLPLVVVLLQFSILQGSMVHHVTIVVEVRKLIIIQAAICHFMEQNQIVLGKPSIVWHRKKLHKIQSTVQDSFCHRHYLKGKKGIIQLQALYRMENIVLFAGHDKETRALVLRVLE
jgi:hypothetical protein